MRALFLALILTGCATTAIAPADNSAACPAVKVYTEAQQRELSSALAVLPQDSPIISAMIDYGRLRAAARACKGA